MIKRWYEVTRLFFLGSMEAFSLLNIQMHSNTKPLKVIKVQMQIWKEFAS